MKYHIGDKFIVQDVLCEVRFINNDKAWVFPLETDLDDFKMLISCVAFEKLDSKLRDSKGKRAIAYVDRHSLAV